MKNKMLLFAIFGTLIAFGSADFCYSDIEAACSSRPVAATSDGPSLSNCNAKYGSFDSLQTELQAYANGHIETSYEYLLMSTHFGTYESNRHGFQGLYKKLSDKAWEKAIDIIKYIAKRGGRMNFNQLPHFKKNSEETKVLELNEISSLAKALDTEKQLAEEALRLHVQTMHMPKQDSGVAHYIEEEFIEPQADTVRMLAGHTSDLKNLLNRDAALAVFLFDEYLHKTL